LAAVKGKVNTTRKVKEKKKKWIRLKERHDKLGTTCSLSAIMKAKEIWEQLRRHDISKTEREDLVSKVNELVKSQVYELSLKHDTARIIQCILKFGNKTRRNEIFDKLSDRFLTMSKIKYAKFVIKGLFRYCTPSQRSQLITSFYNHIPNLLRHKESIKIVELAYNEYANAKERTLMLQEFYGPKFGLFKDSNGKNISEILADNPDEKDHMICHMKKSLMPLLDKNLVKHSIVHQAILEFMLHADDTSRSEMIEGLREVGVEMIHTREGAKVNLHCVWHGTAKDRKVYVKSLKNYVVKICKEEHGHLVLLGIFDSVDDTVLVIKNIINEMIPSLEEVCQDKHGRRVLLYLLNPRSHQYFSSQFLQLLTPGDSNVHSKKSQVKRWSELRAAISPPLIKLLSEKASEWICMKWMAPLMAESVHSSVCDVKDVYSNLCDSLVKPFNEEDHIVSDPCGHWVLKQLISHKRDEAGSSSSLLSDMILEGVSHDSLRQWSTTNRGCFVLISLMLSSDAVRSSLKDILSSSVVQLKESTSDGAKVLLKMMEGDGQTT
jgi:pumilio family protein 6